MAVHYIKLMVNCPFSILYHVLAQAFGHCYRRCLKLENGNSYGVILGGKYFLGTGTDPVITIALEEENNNTFVEIFSYWVQKSYARDVLKILDKLGFTYRVLDDINYFTCEQASNILDESLSKVEGRRIQVLPKNIKNLIPCPFLDFDFSLYYLDVYICRAAKLMGYPSYKMFEKEVIERCIQYKYLDCNFFLEGSRREKELERNE